jgi:hypothetical protein
MFGSPAAVAFSLRPGAVVEMNPAVAEAVFIQRFEVDANIIGEGVFAASHHDRRDEQVTFRRLFGGHGVGTDKR